MPWGQTLVVDNRPGAGGILGTELAAKAAPELKRRFFDNGVAAAPQTPDEFARFIGVEYAKWKKAVELSGAKVE